MVILPVLFLPPLFLAGFNKDFSGVLLVITPLNTGAILNLCPGVVGLSFLTAMVSLPYQ